MRIGNWSPALQIRTILLSIQALLGAPNPDDPLANDVAQRWKEDEQAAIQTAREWTQTYADSPDPDNPLANSATQRLKEEEHTTRERTRT